MNTITFHSYSQHQDTESYQFTISDDENINPHDEILRKISEFYPDYLLLPDYTHNPLITIRLIDDVKAEYNNNVIYPHNICEEYLTVDLSQAK